jgi:hypothetical protein
MRVLVLDLDIFPDRATVNDAVARLAGNHEIRRTKPAQHAGDAAWDRVLADMLAADLVITT